MVLLVSSWGNLDVNYCEVILKFGLSKKHTKFEENLPHGFDKSADLLSKRLNHEEDFFQIMFASQKVRTLHYNLSGEIHQQMP